MADGEDVGGAVPKEQRQGWGQVSLLLCAGLVGVKESVAGAIVLIKSSTRS